MDQFLLFFVLSYKKNFNKVEFFKKQIYLQKQENIKRS